MKGNNFFRNESEFERVQHITDYEYEMEHNKAVFDTDNEQLTT